MSQILAVDKATFDAIVAIADAEKAKRAADMPTEKDALKVMFGAWLRLKELGWREAMYAPKDGTEVNLIEAGSSGTHRGFYSGEYPDGDWFIPADGDLWPSNPILFKLDPADEAARVARMADAAARYAAAAREPAESGS